MVKLFNPPTAFMLPTGDGVSHRLQAVPEHIIDALSPVSIPAQLISSSDFGDTVAIQQTTSSTSPQVFEAVLPDSSLLVGMGSVVLLCIVAGFVWANEVVPVSRTKLAISKSRGEVRGYLDDLSGSSSSDDGIELNATMIAEGTEQQINESNNNNNDEMIKPNVGDGRDFERWLFSDWLNSNKSKGGRQKEPALPILKKAKWNSGDNPVLVTAAIMMLGVVVASVTERIAS
mmetsp:Transcript_10399/g.20809  ORF Transcript_10399/g.20809 Transcript_10399/m.20809 type:complete len:231 (+) Transcript_10399:85-777(+)